ncbi:MAG TPA: hypothetical protein VLT45_10200 [Kofleriaceae bacterium]|nr:hypothetical protein [Kofleriaceae bacterium]
MSFNTWNRIEPTNDAGSAARGLTAPLADPLWLLGRQWQVGELQAEDAATPISATIETTAFPFTTIEIGTGSVPFDARLPLEASVEPEPPGTPDLRFRLTAGRDLRSALVTANLLAAAAALRTLAAPLAGDRATAALIRAVGSDAVDAELVATAVNARGSAAVAAGLDAAHADGVRTVLEAWLGAYRARTGRAAPSAWDAESAAYRFSIVAPMGATELVLGAPAYRGKTLDWCDFTATTRAAPAGSPAVASRPPTTALPSRLSFTGGPARRFFELERAGATFGLLTGAPPDVATALLVETVLVYGGDWFVVPVQFPVGTAARVDRITIVDSFGTSTVLGGRIRSAGWRMFECAGDAAAQDMLPIIPTIAEPLQGAPIESVALVRDETANVVWAIEDVLADELGIGRAVSHDRPPVPSGREPTYVPLVPPPASWFPLVRRTNTFVGAELRGASSSTAPRGAILQSWPRVELIATDVDGNGLRIDRRWQLAIARTEAGDPQRRALWVSRADRVARAPSSAGMATDQLTAPDPTTT